MNKVGFVLRSDKLNALNSKEKFGSKLKNKKDGMGTSLEKRIISVQYELSMNMSVYILKIRISLNAAVIITIIILLNVCCWTRTVPCDPTVTTNVFYSGNSKIYLENYI